MQHLHLTKALSITLLLSCATHTHAMNKPQMTKKEAQAQNRTTIQNAVGATFAPSPDQFPPLGHKPVDVAIQIDNPIKDDVAVLAAKVAVTTPTAVAPVAAPAEVASVARQTLKTLLGKELVSLYSTDEKPLVQKTWIGHTDATLPYKDEDRLIKGLEKNDANYLKDVQAQQDLNRTLNHICAGVIQKIKEQSTLDTETSLRQFTVEQIEAIIDSQFSRGLVLNKILGLCKARIEAKQEPMLYPAENAKELAQKCFTGLSQLQLERKHIRAQQENDRIRQIKAGQRLAYGMRLTTDKGSISDDEYSDAFIFEKTTEGY